MEEENLFDLEGLNLDYEDSTEETKVVEDGAEQETEESDDEQSEQQDDSADEESNENEEEESSDEASEEGDEREVETPELHSLINSLVEEGELPDPEGEEFETEEAALKALISKSKEAAKKEALEEFKASLPEDVKEYIDIAEKGGDVRALEAIKSLPDYNSIELTAKNQELLVEELLARTTSLSEEKIAAKIERYKASGTLEDEASDARELLAEFKSTKEKEYKEKVEAEKAAFEEKQIAQREEFKNKVTNISELNGFKVSKQEATALHDYITKPVGPKGETQYQLDDNSNPEYRLLIPYLTMKKFDKKVLDREAKSKATGVIIKKLKKHTDPTSRSNKATEHGKVENVNFNDLTFDI